LNYMEIAEKGKQRLKQLGIYDTYFGGAAETGATFRRNREYLDAMCFKLNLIDFVAANSQTGISNCKLKTPHFCGSDVNEL
jgi:hypothetical protein